MIFDSVTRRKFATRFASLFSAAGAATLLTNTASAKASASPDGMVRKLNDEGKPAEHGHQQQAVPELQSPADGRNDHERKISNSKFQTPIPNLRRFESKRISDFGFRFLDFIQCNTRDRGAS